MPLLAAEPALFPEDLLSAPLDSAPDSCWWVLHTRPRAEKALARKARAASLSYFLPQYEHRWQANGRLRTAHLPLFPGYVFLYGDGTARRQALETKLVANCLNVPDGDKLLAELQAVWRVLTSGDGLNPEPRLVPGARVEVISGPLTGLEGTILRNGTRSRLYIEVSFLRSGVSAEIESWMVRPLGATESVAVR